MAYRFDLHVRLEAVHTVHDLKAVEAAVRAEVHDPVWFLGRQWQLGEHRGTDAASPGLVHVTVTETPVTGRSAAPEDDPRITPPEAVIESEPEQWWTIGRRVRVGRALRNAVPAAQRNEPGLAARRTRAALRRRSTDGALDGLALYRSRGVARPDRRPVRRARRPRDRARRRLGARRARLLRGVHGRPDDADDPAPRRRRRRLVLRHRDRPRPARRLTAEPCARATRPASPTPARRTRAWWQIEQRRYDPGAVAPHRTRLASLLLINLTASHGDDWFTAPLLSPTGTLVAVQQGGGRGRDGAQDDEGRRQRLVVLPRQRTRHRRAADLADRRESR